MVKINPLIPILVLTGGGLLWYGSRKAKAVGKLQFEPTNVNFSGKFPNYKADLELQITNPSTVPLTVNSIFADILYGDKVIGKIATNQLFSVTPKKQNLISIPIQLKLGQAVASIITSILNKEKLKVFVKGYILSEGVDIPVNVEIPLSA